MKLSETCNFEFFLIAKKIPNFNPLKRKEKDEHIINPKITN
jgi:hypothetical protein